MYIETTFMRYGHGPGGIIGLTLKPETLKTCVLGLHVCCKLEQDTANLISNEQDTCQLNHKEETKSRIKSDGADRENLSKKIELCVDPLDPASHPPSLLNIVSGQIANDTVNVHNAVTIGTKQMQEFESGWPKKFNDTISKRVATISDSKKHIKIGTKKIFDTTVIYSRVIGIQASSRDIDIENVLSHELAPVPTSMFDDSGVLRICKSKSDLKNRLFKESSSRCALSSVSATVLDGSVVLWVVHWPAKGVVADYVENFKKFLERKLQDSDVYLVFDRYKEYSTKSVTRQVRECEASRPYQLTESVPLPSQKAVLTVTANKQQLLSIICNNIINDEAFCRNHTSRNKLVITSSSDTPTEIYKGVAIQRRDISTSHEEADNIIVQQAVINDQSSTLKPLTVKAHQPIIPNLPAAHALSGCDTVANYYGVGKGTVLKTLTAFPDSLTTLGCLDAQLCDVIDQSAKFVGICCSSKVKEKTISGIRYKLWTTKFGNGAATAPKIQTFPPSTEAFVENVKRAHLQTAIWKQATSLDPPNLDPQEYGYIRDESSKTLLPTTVLDGIPLPPESVMKLIKCNWSGEGPCRTMR